MADHKCRCHITYVCCVSADCIQLNCLVAIMVQFPHVIKLDERGEEKQEEDEEENEGLQQEEEKAKEEGQ